MVINLKEILLQIEITLKNDDLDKAYNLYKEIDKNWEKYKISIKKEEIQKLLNLVEFIGKILQEKKNKCFEKDKLLTLRKAYSKY